MSRAASAKRRGSVVLEVEDLTRAVHVDPVSGQRFRVVLDSPAELVPRDGVRAQGWGVPASVTEVTRVVLRNGPVP